MSATARRLRLVQIETLSAQAADLSLEELRALHERWERKCMTAEDWDRLSDFSSPEVERPADADGENEEESEGASFRSRRTPAMGIWRAVRAFESMSLAKERALDALYGRLFPAGERVKERPMLLSLDDIERAMHAWNASGERFAEVMARRQAEETAGREAREQAKRILRQAQKERLVNVPSLEDLTSNEALRRQWDQRVWDARTARDAANQARYEEEQKKARAEAKAFARKPPPTGYRIVKEASSYFAYDPAGQPIEGHRSGRYGAHKTKTDALRACDFHLAQQARAGTR